MRGCVLWVLVVVKGRRMGDVLNRLRVRLLHPGPRIGLVRVILHRPRVLLPSRALLVALIALGRQGIAILSVVRVVSPVPSTTETPFRCRYVAPRLASVVEVPAPVALASAAAAASGATTLIRRRRVHDVHLTARPVPTGQPVPARSGSSGQLRRGHDGHS